MLQTKKSFSKLFFVMLMTFVFVLSAAIPASAAATKEYVFWNKDLNEGAGGVSHASEFIVGAAEVSGTAGNYTIKLKLNNTYTPFPLLSVSYPFLNVDANGAPTGDGTYEVSATQTVSGGYTYFEFSGVNNLTDDLPIELRASVSGIHNTTYYLSIKWQ